MNRRQTLQRLAPLAGLALLGASMGLSGCTGWRVSSAAPYFFFESILITSPGQAPELDRSNPELQRFEQSIEGTDLVTLLRRELRFRHKRRLVDSPLDAQVILKIDSIHFRKSATTFSGAGQVREYELGLELGYVIVDQNGAPLSAPAILEISRAAPTIETAVLASTNQENTLREEMTRSAIQQLVRQLSALRYAPPSTRPQTP